MVGVSLRNCLKSHRNRKPWPDSRKKRRRRRWWVFRQFLRGRERGGCRFTLIAAISLDGRITQGRKEGSQWTSLADKRWFQKELDRYDALIMGRQTFDAIPRPLVPHTRIAFTTKTTSLQTGVCKDVIPFSGSGAKLIGLLEKNGWRRIAVLGGTHIYDWFLRRNLISEMYLTLEPVIFGSGKPLSSQFLNPIRRFRLHSLKRLNPRGTLLLHYTQ